MSIENLLKRYKKSLLKNGFQSIIEFGVKQLKDGNIESSFFVLPNEAGIAYDDETNEPIALMNPGKWYQIDSIQGEQILKSHIESEFSKLYILRTPKNSGESLDVFEDFYEI